MTANQTLTIFIILILYFVGMGFLMYYIGQDTDITIEGVSTDNKFVCKNITCTEKTFVGNIVTGIDSLPIWLNTVAFIIPLALLVLIGILLLIHG